MTEPTEHRWVLDSIEEGIARVEEDGGRMISIPIHLLPVGVKEGQLLRVIRAPAADGTMGLTIAIDESGTRKAYRKSIETTAAAMAESKKKDRGGDVSL